VTFAAAVFFPVTELSSRRRAPAL